MDSRERNQLYWCQLIEKIRDRMSVQCRELLAQAADHEKLRDELRQQADAIAATSKEWIRLRQAAQAYSSSSPEYRRLMNQARAIAPLAYKELMGKANEHNRQFKSLLDSLQTLLPRDKTSRRLYSELFGSMQESLGPMTMPKYFMDKFPHIHQSREFQATIYQDAVDQAWEWFCVNFYRYDASRGSIANWFNNRVKNVYLQEYKRFSRIQLSPKDPDKKIDTLDSCEDKTENPEAAVELNILIENISNWLKSNEKQLKKEGLRKYPQVNCYSVISCKVPIYDPELNDYSPPLSFEEIAIKLEAPTIEVRRFFNRKCFKKMQGFKS